MRDYIPEFQIVCEVCGEGGGTLVKVGDRYRHRNCRGKLKKGAKNAVVRVRVPTMREVREYTKRAEQV